MKTLDILDAKDLESQYKLRPYFIRVHGASMGAFGKPKLWNRAEVERYIEELSTAARREREAREAAAEEQTRTIDGFRRRVRSVQKVSPISDDKIKGRGGRQNVAAA
jgi:tyrosyl-tRNA synthetase